MVNLGFGHVSPEDYDGGDCKLQSPFCYDILDFFGKYYRYIVIPPVHNN